MKHPLISTIILFMSLLANTAAWADMALKYTWQERAIKDGQTQYVSGKQYQDPASGAEKTEYYDPQGQLILHPASWGLKDKNWQNHSSQWLAGDTAAAIAGVKSTPCAVPSFLLTKSLSSPSVVLEGMSAETIANLQTLQQSEPNKPPLIGARRPLHATLTNSNNKSGDTGWQTDAQGNQYLQQRITVTNTKGIRIYLEKIKLPPGAYFLVYDTQNPGKCRGPYDAMFLQGRDALWTESVFSSDVTLAAFVPAAANPADLSFAVKEIVDIFTMPSLSSAILKVGNCHKDVACYNDWQNQAAAVSGIGTVNEIGSLWCTGALLNDNSTPHGNYFMSAYHCIKNQAEADTTEYYWFFQNSACNGVPPSPADVPRTGGAIFLAGMSSIEGNDFCFLQLRQAVPATVKYAGWTNTLPTIGDAVTGIHHPDGSYKRISIGVLNNSEVQWWIVKWQQGVTEGGSSGSPLFNASQLFVGQLQGGNSSCFNPEGIDLYGRFDVSYPIVARWLMNVAKPLYASFANAGIWKYSGTGIDWTQVTASNPQLLVTVGSTLYGTFPGLGIWKFNGADWDQTTTSVPAQIVGTATTLYGAFTGLGIWQWNGTQWAQTSASNPQKIVASTSDLYGTFSGLGIWKWNGTTWAQLTTSIPDMLVTSGEKLYGTFAGLGIWLWTGTQWEQATTSNPQLIAANSTKLYGSFTGAGIWEWDGASTWTQISPDTPTQMTASGTELYAAFTGVGIKKWDGTAWDLISGNEPVKMVVGE